MIILVVARLLGSVGNGEVQLPDLLGGGTPLANPLLYVLKLRLERLVHSTVRGELQGCLQDRVSELAVGGENIEDG
jgi:hypothetical protein